MCIRDRCGTNGHFARNCTTGVCQCGVQGHLRKDCPSDGKKKNEAGKNKKERVFSIHSHKCKQCAYKRTSEEKCIGCKSVVRVGETGHCLKHCSKWLAGGPDAKAKILLDGGGCLKCLASWHETNSNECKNKPRKCEIDGCTSCLLYTSPSPRDS